MLRIGCEGTAEGFTNGCVGRDLEVGRFGSSRDVA